MSDLIERLTIMWRSAEYNHKTVGDAIDEIERLTTENQRIEDEMVSFGRGFEKEIKRLKVSLAGSEGAVSQQHKDIKALRDENGRKQERVDELEVRCQELGDSRDRWQATAQTQDDLLNQQSAESTGMRSALTAIANLVKNEDFLNRADIKTLWAVACRGLNTDSGNQESNDG